MRETSLADLLNVHEPVDFVFEATGYAKHAVEAASALRPNGVTTLQGIPGSWEFEIDGGAFHSNLVVNSRRSHFRAGAEWLSGTPEAVLDELVTGVYGPDEIDRAFEGSDETMKSVVSFDR